MTKNLDLYRFMRYLEILDKIHKILRMNFFEKKKINALNSIQQNIKACQYRILLNKTYVLTTKLKLSIYRITALKSRRDSKKSEGWG